MGKTMPYVILAKILEGKLPFCFCITYSYNADLQNYVRRVSKVPRIELIPSSGFFMPPLFGVNPEHVFQLSVLHRLYIWPWCSYFPMIYHHKSMHFECCISWMNSTRVFAVRYLHSYCWMKMLRYGWSSIFLTWCSMNWPTKGSPLAAFPLFFIYIHTLTK
jgi:hypothetical protein